jgi:hypothetical protein
MEGWRVALTGLEKICRHASCFFTEEESGLLVIATRDYLLRLTEAVEAAT